MMDYTTTYYACPVEGHEHYRLIDAGGCSECYRQRAKASKKAQKEAAKPKPSPINKQSAKKKKREKELTKLRKAAKSETSGCKSCDAPEGRIDYSHILSVAQYPEFELVKINAIRECRKCHLIWENGPLEEKMKQKSWPHKLRVILELKPSHYNKLQMKSK